MSSMLEPLYDMEEVVEITGLNRRTIGVRARKAGWAKRGRDWRFTAEQIRRLTAPLAVATVQPTEAPEAAPTEAPEPTPTDPPPTATPEPTSTPPPADTPTPEAALEPRAALESALRDALGDSNRDTERLISVELVGDGLFVEWAINDNLSEGLIVSGAQLDLSTIMQAVAESGGALPYTELSARGYFPLTDQLGNTEETKVVEAWYDRSTLEEINFSGFDFHNVYAVAKTTRNHELFEPEP